MAKKQPATREDRRFARVRDNQDDAHPTRKGDTTRKAWGPVVRKGRTCNMDGRSLESAHTHEPRKHESRVPQWKNRVRPSELKALAIADGIQATASRLPAIISAAEACQILGIRYAETIDGRPHRDWVPGSFSVDTVAALAREGLISRDDRGKKDNYLRDSVAIHAIRSALSKHHLIGGSLHHLHPSFRNVAAASSA